MNVRIDLNEPKIYEKVLNDRFGLLVSKSWKDLLLLQTGGLKMSYYAPFMQPINYYNPTIPNIIRIMTMVHLMQGRHSLRKRALFERRR